MSYIYYAYFEPSVSRYYYYNTETEETIWEYPNEGDVIDPETQEPFIDPLKRIKNISKNKEILPQIKEKSPMDELKERLAKRLERIESKDNIKKPLNEIPEKNYSTTPVKSEQKIDKKKIIIENIPLPNDFYEEKTINNDINSILKPFELNIDENKDLDFSLLPRPRGNSINNNNNNHLNKKKIFNIRESIKIKITDDENPPLMIEIDKEVLNFKPENKIEVIENKIRYEPPMNGDQPYLPSNIQAQIHQFQIKEFAQEHFKKHKQGIIFKRTTVSIDSLVTFDIEPISKPLLKSLNPSLKKYSLKCFKLILDYCGINNNKPNNNYSIELIHLVSQYPELRDEVYFQLIKQTQNNPNREWLIKTWNLFLIISTIFPSTRNSENWIKSHLAHSMNSTDREISNFARFTYIRFSSRCSIGIPYDYDEKYILEIPFHPKTSSFIFGVSLYEIMWGQRRTFPKCPIPYFLIQMINYLFKKGAKNKEGIFRLPGNLRKVDEMVIASNNGDNIFDEASLDDIASLMKRWFRDLADPIIPSNYVDLLIESSNNNKFIEFTSNLPNINSLTLAYLIGFLQDLSKYENQTKMNISNLSMVFAPNIIQVREDIISKNIIELGKSFLIYLINKWDVSLIYPIKLDN